MALTNRRARALRRAVPVLFAALLPAASGAQRPAPLPASGWQREFDRARTLADDGALRDAERIFDDGVRALPDAAPLRAYAYFGRAFVAQQRLVAGDTVGLPAASERVLADYARAQALDAKGIGIAAHNNAGTLLRGLGRRDEARHEFLAAALSGPHPDRATFYLNAALEYANMTPGPAADSAAWGFRQASRLAPRRPDILRAWTAWQSRVLPVPELLDSLAPWLGDTLRAEIAANALASLLVRTQPELSSANAAAVLVALAASLPTMEVSPARFALLFRERLERAALLHPDIAPGARSLIAALAPATPARPATAPETAGWWRGTRQGEAAWSGVLRWMGDWYFQQDRQPLAQQFYEWALGGDDTSLNSGSVDRRALVPLAMIYVERDDRAGSTKLQGSVDAFTRRMFAAKGNAYARGDLEQIRDFHLALATVYAAKGQWTGPGAESAEYQVEHLRQASRALELRTGRPTYTPPDLLAKLAVHYRQSGNTAAEAQVRNDLRSQLQRQGKSARAEALVRQVDADAARPDALKPAQKVKTTYDPSSAGSIAKPSAAAFMTLKPAPANAAAQQVLKPRRD